MATNLNGKKVLITSGPTWVPIDNVRVISNTATGTTGILLANKFMQQGSKVTLLLGPTGKVSLNSKIKLKRFTFFNELIILLKNELRKDYDIVIQAAAISDFAPKSFYQDKISSKRKTLKLVLKPTLKIINFLRRIKPDAFLVGFKFEPHLAKDKLIEQTRKLVKSADLNLAVGNCLNNAGYSAYLVGRRNKYGPFITKSEMAENLIKLIGREYVKN